MLSRHALAPAIALLALAGFAAPAAPRPSKSTLAPAAIEAVDIDRRIDVNRINLFETNIGASAFDVSQASGLSGGLEFPRGSGNSLAFAAGLWIGARVGGQTRVTVAEYGQEYRPGRFYFGTVDDPALPALKVYKVSRWAGAASDTAHVEQAPADPSVDPLVHHSWSEYMIGAVPYGAPWRVHRLPNTSTPDPFDSVFVSGPDVRGDRMTWCVFNDGNPAHHNVSPGTTAPLGAHVTRSLYAYDQPGALGNIVFASHVIVNGSFTAWDSVYVSEWMDPDVGWFTDDLALSDSVLALGACYNGDARDDTYGAAVPAIGCVVLDAHTGSLGSPKRLTSFARYVNGTDPQSATASYNYMRGRDANGNVVINPGGLPTRYAVWGDPVSGTGWIDTQPADRRIMLNSGPFHLDPGDTLHFDIAYIAVDCGRPLKAVEELYYQAAFARAFYTGTLPVLAQPNLVAVLDTTSTFANGCDDNPYGYAIHSVGGAVAGNFDVRITRSADNLASFTIPGLLAGDSYSRTVGLRATSGYLSGRLDLYVNESYAVFESTHSDNHALTRFTILASQINALSDVYPDQGHQLRLQARAAAYDAAGAPTPITQYEVYRRNTPAVPFAARPGEYLQRLRAARSAGMRSSDDLLSAGWDYIGAMPAHGESEYDMIVPTLADSTPGGGWSVFRVRAATATPSLFFDSCPDSARSVDNLAPGAPPNLRVLASGPRWVALAWDPPGDTDVRTYHVYRGTALDFVPGPGNRIAQTSSLALVDSSAGAGGPYPFYKVAALDAQGNEGPVNVIGAAVTAAGDEAAPRELALRLAGRNPVQGAAALAIDLPAAALAALTVYDVQGRAVRHAWTPGVRAAGRHVWTWNMRDDGGAGVRAGIYFVRLESGGRSKVRRLVVAE